MKKKMPSPDNILTMLTIYKLSFYKDKKALFTAFKKSKNATFAEEKEALQNTSFYDGAIWAIDKIITEQESKLKDIDDKSYNFWFKGFAYGVIITLIIQLILTIIF
jgi:hypothetical protein